VTPQAEAHVGAPAGRQVGQRDAVFGNRVNRRWEPVREHDEVRAAYSSPLFDLDVQGDGLAGADAPRQVRGQVHPRPVQQHRAARDEPQRDRVTREHVALELQRRAAIADENDRRQQEPAPGRRQPLGVDAPDPSRDCAGEQ
jgi:hypothetical protein